jgi:gamma-glutamylcyclotransferase
MTVGSLYCVAYGSNLHPFRFAQRVPSANFLEIVPMPGKRLAFHKRSTDKSGKYLFYEPGNKDEIIYGAIYSFNASEKPELDKLEGLGQGYNIRQLKFLLRGEMCQAYLYVAASTHIDSTLAPYHWYKEMVVLGARYHGLPASYTEKLDAVVSIPDMDATRVAKNEAILENMRRMNAAAKR